MHFYWHFQNNNVNNINIKVLQDGGSPLHHDGFIIENIRPHDKIVQIDSYSSSLYLIGDPIFQVSKKDIETYVENENIKDIICNVDGFYFLLLLNKKESRTIIASSFLNILPIYYANIDNTTIVSSSFDSIIKELSNKKTTTDNQYYLEKALFNYPFLDRTPISEIKTLDSNASIYLDSHFSIKKHLNVYDYFVKNPRSWRRSLDIISEVFIHNAKSFIPDNNFCVTLTGGLDGRTLVGLALSQNKSFYTYSYGNSNTPDINIPNLISKSIGLQYRPFLIKTNYAKDYFWEYGNDFVLKTFGLGNISRSHYAYAANIILNDINYLVSGNFGSEIIRAMKVVGVMTSQMLFDVFRSHDISTLKTNINNNQTLKFINKELIYNNIESLVEDIYSFKRKLPVELTVNQQFYVYLYEHVFPKYFGPEITYQRQFFNHRAPFLNFGFLKELLKTEIAGANSDFMETNPINRYHGQVLYSHIMKKTSPLLMNFMLDKNYRPKDFVTFFGPVKIAYGYIHKKLKNRKPLSSPLFSHTNIVNNRDIITQTPINSSLFNNAIFNKIIESNFIGDESDFINNFSAVLYNNYLNDKFGVQ